MPLLKSLVLFIFLNSISLANTQTLNQLSHELFDVNRNIKVFVNLSSQKNNNLKQIKKTLDVLKKHHFDIAGVSFKQAKAEIIVNQVELQTLSSLKLNYQEQSQLLIGNNSFDKYKNPTEIDNILTKLEQDYPNFVKKFVVGKSFEGRQIIGIKVSNFNKKITKNFRKENILFNGMHHAREVMSPEAVLDIATFLLTHKNETKVANWLNKLNIYLIPMVNVDGNNKVWNGDRSWRKNTAYGYGVDLNRNYPYRFASCDGSSSWRWSNTYRGRSAASEVETQAMIKLITKIRPIFDISFHSYSELVLYPFGCGEDKLTNPMVSKIGKQMGKSINYTAGTPGELLYDVDGDDIDWMYTTLGVVPYVIELNSMKQGGFAPDYDKFRDVTVKRIRPAWQLLLETSISSNILRGTITSKNLDKTIIKIFQNNTLIQKSVPRQDGSYSILLQRGTYNLKIINSNTVLTNSKITI